MDPGAVHRLHPPLVGLGSVTRMLTSKHTLSMILHHSHIYVSDSVANESMPKILIGQTEVTQS